MGIEAEHVDDLPENERDLRVLGPMTVLRTLTRIANKLGYIIFYIIILNYLSAPRIMSRITSIRVYV